MWNEDVRGENGGATYSGYTVFAGETIYAPKDYWDVGYKVGRFPIVSYRGITSGTFLYRLSVEQFHRAVFSCIDRCE